MARQLPDDASTPDGAGPVPWTTPDGRFWWDGQRWVPTPAQRRRTWLLALALVAGTVTAYVSLLLLIFVVVLGPPLLGLWKTFH